MQEMCESDGLTLFANSPEDYKDVIERSGFRLFSVESENKKSEKYYNELVEHLQKPEVLNLLRGHFSEEEIQSTIRGYTLVIESIRENQLLITKFVCIK